MGAAVTPTVRFFSVIPLCKDPAAAKTRFPTARVTGCDAGRVTLSTHVETSASRRFSSGQENGVSRPLRARLRRVPGDPGSDAPRRLRGICPLRARLGQCAGAARGGEDGGGGARGGVVRGVHLAAGGVLAGARGEGGGEGVVSAGQDGVRGQRGRRVVYRVDSAAAEREVCRPVDSVWALCILQEIGF